MTIRPARPEDASAVLDIYRPWVTDSAVSFEEELPSVSEMASRIENSHAWLVAEREGRLAGYAYAARFHPRPAYRWSAEVSIYLAEDSRGEGLGRELLDRLLAELRDRGFVNAFAGTTLPNSETVTFFESAGFVKVAHQRNAGFKFGAWHDVGWWQLQLQEPTTPPPDLRSARRAD